MTASSKKLELFTSDDETCLTVQLRDEDHTLGNALRYVIAKHPKTDFVGYSVPHPSEPVMNIRIQTNDTTLATDVLKEGTNNLKSVCESILEKFEAADR